SCDDDGRGVGLPGLIQTVLDATDVGRIRLGSIEPQDVDSALATVMADSGGRVAPFLHMCLQSGCDTTLRRMGRVYDTALFYDRMEIARAAVPNLSFGTDLIVGFPGESDAEFEESRAFCERARFSHMHVFRYSKRPGTPAAEMDGQVDPHVMAFRAACMHEDSRRMRLVLAHSLVGQNDAVVVQAPGRGVTGGLFDAALDPSIPVNSLVPVRIAGVLPDASLSCEVLD
ncbi:MAG: 2-methylthioadenine synthetase, partial [Atopobiaceae bacterium]|nr:2-methylthioadenine synthetase [Atopobiaceae bacterium]